MTASDQVLVAGNCEVAYRVEAVLSRVVHLCLLDAPHVALTVAAGAGVARAQALIGDVLTEHRY